MDIMPLYDNALSKFFLKCFRRIGFFFRYVLFGSRKRAPEFSGAKSGSRFRPRKNCPKKGRKNLKKCIPFR